jgi:two-component system, chemotaxis family, chemotaxis protein CheY
MCSGERQSAVLVVEDDEDTRATFAHALTNQGYNVWEAQNGAEALELLEKNKVPPCLVLLDMVMPVMNGTELMLALSRHHRFSSIPVVVCSGAQVREKEQAQAVIRKPVALERLLELVADYCEGPR